MYFGDSTFLILIPALLLALYAQAKVKSTYRRYAQITSASRMTGAQAARTLLDSGGAGNVAIERIPGNLTDHYDPRKHVLRLSAEVHDGSSLAALGIAAHETGHALQHHEGFVPLQFRNAIFPVVNIGSNLAIPMFIIGVLMSRQGPSVLMDIGILLFSLAVLFSVITLPVEFNASKWAIALLEGHAYLSGQEIQGARRVLSAAALTYVAATTMAVLQLVRMLMIRSTRD
jgi:Zn-dependent membrane protease YugP